MELALQSFKNIWEKLKEALNKFALPSDVKPDTSVEEHVTQYTSNWAAQNNLDPNDPTNKQMIDTLNTIGCVELRKIINNKTPSLGGYSQTGDTCGAASIVSALMIADIFSSVKDQSHMIMVSVIDNALKNLNKWKDSIIEKWIGWAISGTNNKDDNKAEADYLYADTINILTKVRNKLTNPNYCISEEDYSSLSGSFYVIFASEKSGMGSGEISAMLIHLGIKSTRSTNVSKFDDIFENNLIKNLKPNQIAQISFRVNNEGNISKHAFLIGRMPEPDCRWFLYDQGTNPITELFDENLPGLKDQIINKINKKEYSIDIDNVNLSTVVGVNNSAIELLNLEGAIIKANEK